MIATKKSEYDKFDKGVNDLNEQLKLSEDLQTAINDYVKKIRDNDAEIGKLSYSVKELEKFNKTLQSEIDELDSGELSKDDMSKLTKLKKSFKSYYEQKIKLQRG